jgi:hypothetical protein
MAIEGYKYELKIKLDVMNGIATIDIFSYKEESLVK